MAEGLISGLVEQLLQLEGIDEGVEKDVGNLLKNLVAIQAVLFAADQKQFLDSCVRQWVEKVQDFCYEADGVLVEWRTMIEKEGGEIGLSSGVLCFCLPFTCFGVYQFHRRDLRRDISRKIIEMNQKLEEIAADKEKYTFDKRAFKEQQRMTIRSTPFVNLSEIYGRAKEKDILISKLLSKGGKDNRGLEVIPIVGMGGIGKTTLAQLAYNDEWVSAHFDLRIWVHVGDPSDLVSITEAIIIAISGHSSELFALESLLQCICESIRGKRFLLVLDDVWAEDWSKWESLLISLEHGDVGSKVLVTTQNEKIAAMMGTTTRIVLETLSDQCCWYIFRKLAFLGRDWEEFREIEEIGEEIVMKCKGLPLVAKTLGSLMRSKRGTEEWEAVFHHQLWELHDFSKTLFAPFLLSYYDLSPVEKLCLSYCSLFPSGHSIDRDNLIELWMSQGFFDANKNAEIGKNCFESLAMRSFFQDFEKNLHGFTKCKMHGVIHDFLQFVTRNSCFIWVVSGGDERSKPVNKTTRHCTLLISSEDQIPNSAFEKKKLRTLFVVPSKRPIDSIPLWNLNLLSELASLRTLSLPKWGIEKLPGGIGKLMHLRYLNLSSNSRLKELPYELCDLLHLQTLRLNYCTALQSLPKQMGKLVNLRHLYIRGCSNLKELPKGIGRLTSLRILDEYIVPCDYLSNNEAMKLVDLSQLGRLEYLSIRNIGSIEDAGDAVKAELWNKQNLVDLELAFLMPIRPRPRPRPQRTEDELVDLRDALQPPADLKCLRIFHYDGAKFPNWMASLVNLREIVLSQCYNCEFLPPCGKLPFLETLYINIMNKVEKVGLEFLGVEETGSKTTDHIESSSLSFPQLKKLRFGYLHNWKQWLGIGDSLSSLKIMPVLHNLEIEYCFALETLPDFLQTMPVKELVISECPILMKRFQEKVGEYWHLISHIPNIKICGGGSELAPFFLTS